MFKNISIILILVSYISVVSCQSANGDKSNTQLKEFEGVITYHEIEKSSDGLPDIDDTVQLFYSHGNYVNVHSSKVRGYYAKDYYLEKEPLRLLLFNNSDSLYKLPLDYLPMQKLEKFEVKKVKDRVLSRECESIQANFSFLVNGLRTYTDVNFVVSRGFLKVDKGHFKNWNLGFFNKVVDETGAYYLKLKTVHFDTTHKNILSSKTLDVISVKEGPVDPAIFEIDRSLIVQPKQY